MNTIGRMAVVVLLACASTFAQQIAGNIRGTVFDSSGAVLSGAAVTAQQEETGLARTAATDPSGNYTLLELPVGHYRVEVTAKGFHKHIRTGIHVNVNDTASIPIYLAVGSENELVEVRADVGLIEPTVTAMGKTVFDQELLALPLNGRNFSQLGLLQPGVVPLTAGLSEAGGALLEGQAYAVNGQRPESNNLLIDGANNLNGVDSGFVLKPPVDAITEFRILTHNAPAEFGGSLGSTTNIITRSGSNSVHGTRWEFIRNDAFDAKNYFADRVEPLKQNQFGGTIGGPIRQNRTFFFGFYEGFRNRQGKTARTTVPSVKQRQGDFSELCTEGFTNGFCNNPAHQLFNIFFNQPYSNNRMPSIHPLSQALRASSLSLMSVRTCSRVQGANDKMVDAIAEGALDRAGLTQAECALLDYVKKGTECAARTTPRDVQLLRDAGWSEPQIAEAAYITALFAFFNRVADAFGVPPQGYLELNVLTE